MSDTVAAADADHCRPKACEIVWMNSRKNRGEVGIVPPMNRMDWEETVGYAEELEQTVVDRGMAYAAPPSEPPTWLDCIDFIAHLETTLEDAGATIYKPGIAMEEPNDNRDHTAKHPMSNPPRVRTHIGERP